jgi:hypothetical protein
MSRFENPITIFEGLALFEDRIEYNGNLIKHNDISSVSSHHSIGKVNFFTTSKYSRCTIKLKDGTLLEFKESGLIFNGDRHDGINRISLILKDMTLKSRIIMMIDDLKKYGQVMIHNSTDEKKVIYLNREGMIGNQFRGIDLKTAAQTGTVGFGKYAESLSGLNKQRNGDYITVSNKRTKKVGGIPEGAMHFIPNCYDVDVVQDVIWWFTIEGNKL